MVYFDWPLWFVHLLMSVCVVAGYMAFYNTMWAVAYGDSIEVTPQVRRAVRIGIPVVVVIVTICLNYAAHVDPINDTFYRNLQLFVIAILPLDDGISLLNFISRLFIFGGWLYVEVIMYTGDMRGVVAGLISLVVFGGFIRKYQETIHYSFPLIFLLAVFVGSMHWFPQPGTTTVEALAHITTYVFISMFAFLIWKTRHDTDLERHALMERANFDLLTNAKTYARFHDDIGELVVQSLQNGQPMTMVMLDIDRFKAVNDKFGHLAGNDVLIGVSALLENYLNAQSRPHLFYRTGGEEFNIVFPGSTPASVLPLMEECWRLIQEYRFTFDDTEMGVTISVGITELQDGDVTVEDIFKRADANLYASKQRSRGTITVDGVTKHVNDHAVVLTTYAYFVQPIMSLRTDTVQRYEVLLRMFDRSLNR